MQRFRLLVAGAAHFSVDSYATMLTPLLPLVNARLGLNLTLAGLLGSIVYAISLSQPLMGVWGDRMRRRHLIIVGALLSALFTPLMGVAPNFVLLVIVLSIGALGVHAFHPQTFAVAGELSGDRRTFGLALFSLAGTSGLALTPLWAPAYAHAFGLEALPLVSVPGLLMVLLTLKFLPLDNPHLRESEMRPSLTATVKAHAPEFALISVVVSLRWVTGTNFAFFLTLLAQERGLSLEAGGFILAVFSIAGVLGSLVFGYLADRANPKPLIWGSILVSAPFLYSFLHADGAFAFFLLAAGGFAITASNSIMVAIAQELAPENAGLASSIPLGFSWGLAGLSLPLTGYVADRIGVEAMLEYVALLPLLTFVLALFLKVPQKSPVNRRKAI